REDADDTVLVALDDRRPSATASGRLDESRRVSELDVVRRGTSEGRGAAVGGLVVGVERTVDRVLCDEADLVTCVGRLRILEERAAGASSRSVVRVAVVSDCSRAARGRRVPILAALLDRTSQSGGIGAATAGDRLE